jgi:hypothetical protein
VPGGKEREAARKKREPVNGKDGYNSGSGQAGKKKSALLGKE